MTILWDRKFSVRVTVSGDKLGTTCGLCGIFNNDPSDDMIFGTATTDVCLPDDAVGTAGELVTDEVVFGVSWFHSIDTNEAMCEQECYELPIPTEPCEDPVAERICSKLRNRRGPLRVRWLFIYFTTEAYPKHAS